MMGDVVVRQCGSLAFSINLRRHFDKSTTDCMKKMFVCRDDSAPLSRQMVAVASV